MEKITILPSTDVNDLAKRLLQQQNINYDDIVGANVIETSTIIVYSYPIVKHKRTAKCTELGKCDNELRAPLVTVNENTQKIMDNALRHAELLN